MVWQVPAIALAMMVLDVLFGFVQAVKNGSVDSTKMRDGLFHKLGFIGAIVVAYLCEYALLYIDLGFSAPIVVPVCSFIILTELVSVLENLVKLTPELGDAKFMKIFGQDVDGD